MRNRQFIPLFCALAFTACQSATTDVPSPPQTDLSFVVIGDTPYGAEDEKMLQDAVPLIKAGDYPFVIHIGDYKGGRAECLPVHDERHQKLFQDLAPIPMIYTPGDNEWTDCDRNKKPNSDELYSDLERLAYIRETFFSPPQQLPADMFMHHQIAGDVRENVSWSYNDVWFLTLHVTGTNNGRDWVTGDTLDAALASVNARDKANLDWLGMSFTHAKSKNAQAVVIAMQSDMNDIEDKPEDVMCETVAATSDHACDGFTTLRAAIRDAAIQFGKPVLLIHGDTAPFTLKQQFSGEEAPNLWLLNAAGDTGPTYGTRDVTRVDISLGQDMPFRAEGLITGKRPKTK